MTFFWALFGFDIIVALVVLVIFFIGMADGSVSTDTIGLWVVILLALAGIVLGGFFLMRYHYLLS